METVVLAAVLACAAAVQGRLPVSFGPDWVTAGGFGFAAAAGLLLGRWGIVAAVSGALAGAYAVGADDARLTIALAGIAAEAALAAAWRRNGLPFAPGLDRPADVFTLVAGCAAAAGVRGLAVGLAAVALDLPDPAGGAAAAMAVGVLCNLIAVPAATVWLRAGAESHPPTGRAVEGVAAFAVIVGLVGYWVGGPAAVPLRQSMPVVAVLLGSGYWMAFRFDTRGVTAVIVGVTAVVIGGALGRGTLAPLLPAERPIGEQLGVILGHAAVVGFYHLMAAVARDYRLREAERAEWAVAAKRQTERLREVNERLALQSLELADQAAEVERQRDDYQRLARELADKRAWLETVLAQLPVGILLIDKELRSVQRNRRYESILGLPPDATPGRLDELKGWPIERTDGTPLGFDEWPLVRAIRDGVTTDAAELRVCRKDGSGWAEVSAGAAPIRGADGKVQGAVLVVADVAAVRKAERAARENEARLRFALRSARMLAWEWDLSTDRVSRSDSLEGWLGMPADPRHRVYGSFAERLHPDDRAAVQALSDKLRAGRLTEFVIEYRLRHADGSDVWVESRGQYRPASAGRPAGSVVGVLTDVTERRRSEERLRLLESAVVHANDAVIVLEASSMPGTGRRARYVNDAFTRITGYPREETLDRSLHFLRGQNTDTATLDRLRQALDRCEPFAGELLNYRKDGAEVWVDLSVVPVAGPDGRCTHFVMIQRDVTDRKRAEQAVRLREEQLRAVGDNLPDGLLYQWEGAPGRPFRFRYMSAGVQRLTGLTADAVVAEPHTLFARVLADDLPAIRAAEAASHAGGERFDCEFRVQGADGQVRWLHARAQPFAQPDGTVLWNGVMLDVTARRKAEAAVRESEQLFRGLFETTSAGVSLVGPDGTFVACNPAFAALLGRTPTDVLGHSPAEFSHPDDTAAQQPLLDEVAAGRRDQYQFRKRYRRPDGRTVWTELSATVVRGSGGEFLYSVGVSVDVTARQSLEDQLRQAQKMEALGQMAGGIAHDFNNLLTAVIGNLGLVKLADGDPARPLLRTVEQAATRAADLTRKLLGYARRNQLLVAPVRPSEMFGEVVDILRRTLDPRIEIRVEVLEDALLSADATLINQAVFNLCLNARDAMPAGGVLTLAADAVTFPEGVALPARPGAFARLSVIDTGDGMAAEVRDRLFEPFFTTKGVGKGTGLGLPMVHGIMTQHEGWVTVDTAPGQGARFDLYLPAAGLDQTPPPRPALELPPAATHVPLRVLLVDDEAMIRALARAILESAGHMVTEAEDGLEAVELFEQRHAEIDLVLLDLTMPRMSGRDAFRRMMAIDPGARVLFSSGYSADDLSEVDGARGLLSKPYRPADLLAAVRRAASEEPAAV